MSVLLLDLGQVCSLLPARPEAVLRLVDLVFGVESGLILKQRDLGPADVSGARSWRVGTICYQRIPILVMSEPNKNSVSDETRRRKNADRYATIKLTRATAKAAKLTVRALLFLAHLLVHGWRTAPSPLTAFRLGTQSDSE